MQQKIILSPKGLYTNVNQLGVIPPGALTESNNVVISRPGVLGVRRGRKTNAFFASIQGQTGQESWVSGPRPLRLFNAKLRVGGQLSNNFLGTPTPGIITMMSDGTMYWSPDGVTFTKVNPTYGLDLATLPAPDSDRHWYGFEQNGSFFITTSAGVIKVGRPLTTEQTTTYAAPTPEQIADWSKAGYAPAGVPWGVNTQASLTSSAGTAITPDSQVGYRFCFGYRDANNILQQGAPSSRAVVINTQPSGGTSYDAKLATQIPPGIIPTRHFWQLYRTLPSSSATTDPGDDCGLVAEGAIPSDITIDQMSRTGTVLTCRSSAPNSLIASDATNNYYVKLKSSVTVPGSSGDGQFFITRSGNTRTVNKKTGPSGAITQIATFTITQTETFTNTFRPNDYPNGGQVLLFEADPVTGNMYYIEEYAGYVYIIAPVPQAVVAVSLGSNPDAAVFDSGTRTIKMLSRPVASTWDVFNYCAPTANGMNGYFYVDFDPDLLASTVQAPGAALASCGVDWFTQTPTRFSPYEMRKHCKLGVWRANDSTQTFVCLAMFGSQQGAQVAITSNSAATWSYQYCIFRNTPGAADALPTVTAGDTVRNPHSQQTTFSFCVNDADGNVVDEAFWIDTYYIINSGTNTPELRRNYSQSSQASGPGIYTFKATAIRCHRETGQVLFTTYTSDQFNDYDGVDVSFSGLNTWVPSYMVGPINVGIEAYGYVAPTGTIQDTGVDSLITYERATHASGTQYLWASGSSSLTLVSADTAAYSWGGTNGTVSSGGSAFVAAGPYKVDTVIDSTHFTITSVQSPQVDFVATTVDVLAQQLEIYHTDTVDPAYIGPLLYSSPSVEGALQTNFPPPLCKDAALFRTTAFYANTISRTLVQVTMLRLPVVGERLYIGSNGSNFYVTAGTTEDLASLTYKIGTAGSLSEKIHSTINSLARIVNLSYTTFNNLIYSLGVGATAYSTFIVSAVVPGNTVAVRSANSLGFTIIGAFSPNEVYGEAQKNLNLLAYSKTLSPDAVPLTNNIRIGSDSKAILRVLPSRDALFVFKEDGAFIVRGYGPPWQVDPFDLTLQLKIKDSLVLLDNAVFGAFSRGVYKVSDSNVELLSLPVQNLLEPSLVGTLNQDATDYGFAMADNPDHKYILWIPTTTDINDYSDIAFVYDTFTNEWTTWDMKARHAVDYQNNIMFTAFQTDCLNGENAHRPASGAYPAILSENKDLTANDFHDDTAWVIPDTKQKLTATVKLINYNPTLHTITLGDTVSAGGANLDIFDIIVPLGQTPDYVDAVMLSQPGLAGQPVTILNKTVPWLTSGVQDTAVTVYRGIKHSWKFLQAFPESPAATNHFSEFVVSFREAYWSLLEATFELPTEQQDPIEVPQIVLFDGTHHFGPSRVPSKNNFVRTYVPRQSQRGTTLIAGIRTGVCGTNLESNGITVQLTQGPTSFQRR